MDVWIMIMVKDSHDYKFWDCIKWVYVAVVSRQPWWLILVTKDKWLIWKMYKNLKCSLWWYIGRDNGRKCWTDIYVDFRGYEQSLLLNLSPQKNLSMYLSPFEFDSVSLCLFSVQFSSRWYLCTQKSPYALHPISRKFSQYCFWNRVFSGSL